METPNESNVLLSDTMTKEEKLLARKYMLECEQQRMAARIAMSKREDSNYALRGDPKLNDTQKAIVDAFWKKYKFLCDMDYTAVQTYSNRSGIFDPRYLPHYFVRFFVRPYTAPDKYMSAFQNKAYLGKLLKDVKQPETIVRRIEGIYYNEQYQKITVDDAVKICMDVLSTGREIVVKPSGLAGGKGVIFLTSSTKQELKKIFKSKGQLFVVQKAIRQHPEMAALNSSTVNTVRLTTFLFKGKFHALAALIKVGSPNVRVDNYKHGGCLIGVRPDGSVLPWALNIQHQRITELPSGVKLGMGGFTQVPGFDSVLATAEKAHYQVSNIKMISWDIAIGDDGEAQIIEANFGGDLRMHQVLTGPVFGEMTEEILDHYVMANHHKRGIHGDFDYEEYLHHVVIARYYGEDAHVTVPHFINGKPVTIIGEAAFAFNKKLVQVTLPPTVLKLDKNAFYACSNLERVDANFLTLRRVGQVVFGWCPKLDKELRAKFNKLQA